MFAFDMQAQDIHFNVEIKLSIYSMLLCDSFLRRIYICISWLDKKKSMYVFLVCLNVFIAVSGIQASLVLFLNLCIKGFSRYQNELFLHCPRNWVKMKCFTSKTQVLYLEKRNQIHSTRVTAVKQEKVWLREQTGN